MEARRKPRLPLEETQTEEAAETDAEEAEKAEVEEPEETDEAEDENALEIDESTLMDSDIPEDPGTRRLQFFWRSRTMISDLIIC